MTFNSIKKALPRPFLIWITGMPGSGKTTLANNLASSLRVKGQHCIQLDGDELRHILRKEDLNTDYSLESRLELALLYSRLAVFLNSQGFIVVVSTVSLFWEVHKWNRLNTKNYFEVFLDVDSSLLDTVPRSGLYKAALESHFSPEFPVNPDLVLKAKNTTDRTSWLSILEDSLLGKV
jgi:adenylylsulfate kinase